MRNSNIFKIWLLLGSCTLSLGGISVAADSPITAEMTVSNGNSTISRGLAVQKVVEYFDLEKGNKAFLTQCEADPAVCLFAFEARTNFDGLKLNPLILYPDVYPAYRYYEAINTATMLDLVSGYYIEENSPFRPEAPISKVEALKLVMGAAGVLDWKEKFELSLQDQSWLELSLDGERWWYGRYLAMALTEGFIDQISQEEAESHVSEAELLKIMEGANKIVADRQTSSLADRHGQAQQTLEQADNQADTSGNSAI